jgi:TRAP-type C4-dicarboxylate transport system permease small subunit
LFFVPRLRIWWGAAICCCCSAAASIVMWGCRKWHSLLER